MDIPTFLIQVLNSIQYGLLLFLVASGLTLIFGIMGVINLAHGSFYMLGAYLSWSLTHLTGSLVATLVLGTPLAILFGFVLEKLFIARLYRRDHLQQVLLTYGLILVLEEMRSVIWGDDPHAVPVPAWLDWSFPLTDTLSYPAYRLFISAFCLVLAGGMVVLINWTRHGMRLRAAASNGAMAEALGVDTTRLHAVVFALGVGLAALAGMIAAPAASVFPGMGSQVLITSFVVVVIGGIGSIRGAMVAALLVGFADTFGKVLMPGYAGMSVYVLMAAVLLFRPSGLFGRASG